MKYFIKKEVESFIEKMAVSNVSGFYPSLIKKTLDLEPQVYIPILEELVGADVLYKKYILRNPENPIEKKEFDYFDLPIGDYYDDFHFGDEFFVTEDNIVVLYKIRLEFKEELKKKKVMI